MNRDVSLNTELHYYWIFLLYWEKEGSVFWGGDVYKEQFNSWIYITSHLLWAFGSGFINNTALNTLAH